MIYLDSAATSFFRPPEVLEAVAGAMTSFGNPSRGGCGPSLLASRTVFQAREALNRLFEMCIRDRQKGRPNGSYGSGSYQSAFVGIGNPCKRKPSKREGKYMSLKKLEVHHATKRIHGNTVLQDISCTFLSGKIYGLKGINGSGKTMFMRLLLSLIHILSNGKQLPISEDRRKTAEQKYGELLRKELFYE